jgi:cytochrome bd ubiquinol oxidase subunit II
MDPMALLPRRLLLSSHGHAVRVHLRGVKFEFRSKASRRRWHWDVSFAAGSFAASFMQGAMVGAPSMNFNLRTVSISAERSVGSHPLREPGFCFSYALLGACWLVRKSDGPVCDAARRQIALLAICLLAFLVVVFVYARAERLRIVHRWIDRPYQLR